MRWWWATALAVVVLGILLPTVARANVYDPSSAADLEEHGWELYEESHRDHRFSRDLKDAWCKTLTEVTDDDRQVLPFDDERVQAELDNFADQVEDKAPEEFLEEHDQRSDLTMACVQPENDQESGRFFGKSFFCVSANRKIAEYHDEEDKVIFSLECWDKDFAASDPVTRLQDGVADATDDFTVNPLDQFINSLTQGFRWFLAMLLYWWVMIPHVDLASSPVGLLWPPMLGLGVGVGILLLIWQGVKMMFTQKAPALFVETLKGIFYFFLWTLAGIGVISLLGNASESLTQGILNHALDTSMSGCNEFQTSLNEDSNEIVHTHPDGLELTYEAPEGAQQEIVERSAAMATCMSVQTYVKVGFGAFMLLFFVIAFIMGLIQGLLLFIREAAFPLMALLLPIAAAGQIGGTVTRRWLPNLVAMIMTMLAYKPMIALIFAVGFSTSSLSNEVMDILRGLLTLLIGVVAPSVLLKAFTPIATQGVENMASLGSATSNMLTATQVGGGINRWLEKRSGAQAAAAAPRKAASQAAQQGGQLAMTATKHGAKNAAGSAATAAAGTAAAGTAAAGPVGWLAKAGQSLANLGKSVVGKSTGPEANAARQNLRRNPHMPGQASGAAFTQQSPGRHPHQRPADHSPAGAPSPFPPASAGPPAPAPSGPGHRPPSQGFAAPHPPAPSGNEYPPFSQPEAPGNVAPGPTPNDGAAPPPRPPAWTGKNVPSTPDTPEKDSEQ